MDGDGDLDLVSTDFLSGSLAVLRNDGSGAFPRAQQRLYPVRAGSGLLEPALGDFDGDGDLDVAVAVQPAPSSVTVLLNNGNAVLGPGTDVRVSDAGFLSVADLDGDGTLDLACTNEFDQSISVRFNTDPLGTREIPPTAPTLTSDPARQSVCLRGAPTGPVILLDALGRPVRTTTVLPGQSEVFISLQGLSAGLYAIRSGTRALKLIVER
ncbi:MAG TPA: FG-GAP-like repeat-containing protein, partial [bacterium]|nr:FG-GAP-like repeat-containing protein [bacterium]